MRVFVTLALILGVAQAFLHPPEQVNDEGGHLAQSIRIAIGDWFPRRGDVFAPASPEMIAYQRHFYMKGRSRREQAERGEWPVGEHTFAEYWTIPAWLPERDSEHGVMRGGSARINPPYGYFGQAVALTVSDWFDDSPALHYFAGRVGSLAAATSVTALAIAILPVGRWLFVFGAMTPMVVVLRSSFSADAMMTAMSFLLVALVVRARVRTERIAAGEVAAIALTAVGCALLKSHLVLFASLALLLPRERFAARWHWVGAITLIGALPLAATLSWWSWLAATESSTQTTYASGGVAGYFRLLPLLPQFAAELPEIAFGHGWRWLGQFVGNYYGTSGYRTLTVALPGWAIVAWAAAAAVVCATAPAHPRLRGAALSVALLVWLGLGVGTMFLFWIGPHLGSAFDHSIHFMQGRYFHPALGLLAPAGVALAGLAPGLRARIPQADRVHRWTAVGASVALVATSLLTNVRMNLGWPG